MTAMIGGLRRRNRLGGKQQPGIQIEPDMAVIHPWLVQHHRILISAKFWQALFNKMIENSQRLLACDRKAKIFKIAKMIRTSRRHKIDNCLRHLIRRKLQRRRNDHAGFWRFTVIAVKIPFAADRIFAFHQNIMCTPHFTIKEIHPQLASAIRPFGKSVDPA